MVTLPPGELVRASFEFLLEREPATSILREFSLDVISQYFPGYPAQIRARLGSSDPEGFQNSATVLDQAFYAARSYSLMRPPRTGWRLIRFWKRSAGGWSGRDG